MRKRAVAARTITHACEGEEGRKVQSAVRLNEVDKETRRNFQSNSLIAH